MASILEQFQNGTLEQVTHRGETIDNVVMPEWAISLGKVLHSDALAKEWITAQSGNDIRCLMQLAAQQAAVALRAVCRPNEKADKDSPDGKVHESILDHEDSCRAAVLNHRLTPIKMTQKKETPQEFITRRAAELKAEGLSDAEVMARVLAGKI